MDASLPTTAYGWAGMILAGLTILIVLGRMGFAMAKYYVKAQVNTALEFTVRKAVMDGMALVNVRLDAMQVQLITQDGELARIREIEETINNGLKDRQERIEKKVDTLIEHHMWDGKNRRTE